MQRQTRWLAGLAMLVLAVSAAAQAPAGSAPSGKEDAYRGMTLNTAFSGSIDSGSHVYEWTTAAGYIFNPHFAVNFGVPVLFT